MEGVGPPGGGAKIAWGCCCCGCSCCCCGGCGCCCWTRGSYEQSGKRGHSGDPGCCQGHCFYAAHQCATPSLSSNYHNPLRITSGWVLCRPKVANISPRSKLRQRTTLTHSAPRRCTKAFLRRTRCGLEEPRNPFRRRFSPTRGQQWRQLPTRDEARACSIVHRCMIPLYTPIAGPH